MTSEEKFINKIILDVTEYEVLRSSMQKLEGVSEGLSPFHPGVASFMNEQINGIFRVLLAHEPSEVTAEEWSKLTFKSKSGYEEIDDHVELEKKELKGRIQEKKILKHERKKV